jgi:hypothetical protein
MSTFSSQPIVIDGKGHLLGRLASTIAKQVGIGASRRGGRDFGRESMPGEGSEEAAERICSARGRRSVERSGCYAALCGSTPAGRVCRFLTPA